MNTVTKDDMLHPADYSPPASTARLYDSAVAEVNQGPPPPPSSTLTLPAAPAGGVKRSEKARPPGAWMPAAGKRTKPWAPEARSTSGEAGSAGRLRGLPWQPSAR